eukprot:maker-scaffold_11-snap-gene-5.11-mRNA-1 protein AED:0.01 eAED:0.01 QI:0/1/0.5/1/1/1/2/368/454
MLHYWLSLEEKCYWMKISTNINQIISLGLLYPKGQKSRFLLDSFFTPTYYTFLNSHIRSLQHLENVFHPILNPASRNKLKIPLPRLETNIRFQYFIRRLYLKLKFDKKIKEIKESSWYGTYRSRSALEHVFNTNQIFSSRQELLNKKPDLMQNSIIQSYHQSFRRGKRPQLSFEQCLESIGCCIYNFTEFNYYCEASNIYDFYTHEYIDGLSDYLIQQSNKIKSEHVEILEVGAGNGFLGGAIIRKLAFKGASNISYRLTDDYSWGLSKQKRQELKVERLSVRKAVEINNPHIIICAWMPNQVDFTKDFFVGNRLKEYILIGESGHGCCGHTKSTWNEFTEIKTPSFFEKPPRLPKYIDIFDYVSKKSFKMDDYDDFIESSSNVPYVEHGFEKYKLEELTRMQLCRYDTIGNPSNSETWSFRKQSAIDRYQSVHLSSHQIKKLTSTIAEDEAQS